MMKQLHTFLFFISILCTNHFFAQETDTITNKKLKPNNSYGLRVGTDIYKLVRTVSSKDYSGFEINGDYRLTKKYYAAAEIGFEKFSLNETSLSTQTNGSYIKVGFDYNAHKNLLGMRNLIFAGLRFGVATFSQELDSFSIATRNSFFENPQQSSDLSSDGLSANWIEFLVGLKTEILNNVYLGFTISVKGLITEEIPVGFDNTFVPGYGKTNDFTDVGTGFNYYISYFIPLYKRDHKAKKKTKKKVKDEKENETESE